MLLKLILVLLVNSHHTQSSWLYLAVSGVQTPTLTPNNNYGHNLPMPSTPGMNTRSVSPVCDMVQGLNDVQMRICYQHPQIMPSIGRSASEAILECQWQFKYERWNCTTLRTPNDTDTELFGATLRSLNKETAFLLAITSASITHGVTKACSSGNLTHCGCDNNYRGGTVPPEALTGAEAWHWGGCSDNVRYGVRFGREFLDKKELQQHHHIPNAVHLIRVHNQESGREAVKRSLRRKCRCHGVSGSCEFKTCWQQLGKFAEIGEMLKNRYRHYNVQVARRAKRRLRRKGRSERKIRISTQELVFANKSPNYCERNNDMGILGTHGRQCNLTSYAHDSCDKLCCGRGYHTHSIIQQTRCHCKFVWCCHVKCKTCSERITLHTCK